MMSKKQNLKIKIFAKNKPVKSTDHEAATSINQNSGEGSGSKAEKRKFHEFLWLTYDSSNNVMYCDICRKTGPDIANNTKFLVYHNKILKHKKMFIKYGISKSPFLY